MRAMIEVGQGMKPQLSEDYMLEADMDNINNYFEILLTTDPEHPRKALEADVNELLDCL